ncbi:potassium channel family protein [Flavobacteriaceae bacterium S0862]|nr:potassium channel family protein [Flavobacteriaceae bacterium S0862]
MKRKLTIIFFLLISTMALGQEGIEFKTFSHAEFFKMIEQETDTLFELKNAIIEFRPETDSIYGKVRKLSNTVVEHTYTRTDTLYIDKEIRLDNVHFEHSGSLGIVGVFNHVVFNKSVALYGCSGIVINHCKFLKGFRIDPSRTVQNAYKLGIDWFNMQGINASDVKNIDLESNVFLGGLRAWMDFDNSQNAEALSLGISDSKIYLSKERGINVITGADIWTLSLNNNEFIDEEYLQIRAVRVNNFFVINNVFNNNPEFRAIQLQGFQNLGITNNTFKKTALFDFDNFTRHNRIQMNTFTNSFISSDGFRPFISSIRGKDSIRGFEFYQSKYIDEYRQSFAFQNLGAYNNEIKLLGQLKDLYNLQYDNVSANKAFISMKNLETQRLKYLYKQEPNFDTYFQWKVNQFLYLFSDYGTKPSKAIVFSVYVILLFALIYLFFPNSWDRHGRKRIVDRYTFFLKYMDKEAGIHEVYLEDQKEDLLEFADFKSIIEAKENKVPKIFTVTAMPLYKWAVSGTKLTASILNRVDIMKGTWNDLPQSERIWKSILLVGAFLIAVLYDIFIKMLNAVMLSINTFTTLGFGEIPIKGLPRYLAIIQGFIGWFMLTIFSVSLISQLLN